MDSAAPGRAYITLVISSYLDPITISAGTARIARGQVLEPAGVDRVVRASELRVFPSLTFFKGLRALCPQILQWENL